MLDEIIFWHTEFVVQHIIPSLFRLGSGIESAVKLATCQRIYVDTAARRDRVQHNQIQKKLKVILRARVPLIMHTGDLNSGTR